MELRKLYAEGHQMFYCNTEIGIYQSEDNDFLIRSLMDYIKHLENNICEQCKCKLFHEKDCQCWNND